MAKMMRPCKECKKGIIYGCFGKSFCECAKGRRKKLKSLTDQIYEKDLEIERKIRLFEFRMPTPSAIIEIDQGYLYNKDGELRVCKRHTLTTGKFNYKLTIKSDGDLERQEWDSEIPDWVYRQLWPKTKDMRVRKTCFIVEENDLEYEIDFFHGELEGLKILELEFPSAEQARKWSPPEWVQSYADVTSRKEYKVKTLASYKTIPPSDLLPINIQDLEAEIKKA